MYKRIEGKTNKKYFKGRKYVLIKGIALDEQYRLIREYNKNDIFPLVEWRMTEADCLNYCYNFGFNWNGLYDKFSRVSCFCCPLQPLKELRVLYHNYPDLWEIMKQWDKTARNKFKTIGIPKLEKRFDFEDYRLSKGLSISNTIFYDELREIMKGDII